MSFPLHVDLLPLTKVLWGRGISHQILEKGHEQQLWLVQAGQASETLELCQLMARGELPTAETNSKGRNKLKVNVLGSMLGAPITSGVLMITLLLAVLTLSLIHI